MKKCYIARSVVLAGVLATGAYFSTPSRIPEPTVEEQTVQLLRRLPAMPLAFEQVQEAYHIERRKRILIGELEKALGEIVIANNALDQLSSALQSPEDVAHLDSKIREYGIKEVWAQSRADRASYEFIRLGNAEQHAELMSEMPHLRMVYLCVSLLPNEQKELLDILSWNATNNQTPLSSVPDDSVIGSSVGKSAYDSICETQSLLYRKGCGAWRRARNRASFASDTFVLEVMSGFVMTDIGLVLLREKNEGFAYIGKTRLESCLQKHTEEFVNSSNPDVYAKAAAYIVAMRTVLPNLSGQLTTILATEKLSDFDSKIHTELNAMRDYAPKSAGFKSKAMRLRSKLFDEIIRFENTRTIWYNADQHLRKKH